MVFSVSPMNTSPDYVHPVAENFTDFLRLILACGDVAAVEQAWMWNEAQFEAFLNENPTTQEQQQTLSEISEKMNLLPMEQPWTYIKNLQSSFDYSQIKYTEDYYDNDMTSEAELVALNGRSTLMEISGDIEVKTVPEKRSSWINNSIGLDIIG